MTGLKLNARPRRIKICCPRWSSFTNSQLNKNKLNNDLFIESIINMIDNLPEKMSEIDDPCFF